MELITESERARLKARAIVSDILVYNPDKLKEGIENDNLFELLEEELKEGKEFYDSQIAPDILERTNFYDRAIVDILVKFGGKHPSNIW